MDVNHNLLDGLEEFLSNYYREDIAKIAQEPNDRESLWIGYEDIWRFDPDLADDLRNHPEEILNHISEAITLVDVPLDVDLSHVTPRVTGLDDEYVYRPDQIRKDHGGDYVGITGTLERVTSTSDLAELTVHVCDRCGTETRIPQDPAQSGLQEPHECGGCERQGPFQIDHNKSEFADYAKLRIESRPDAGEAESGKIAGFVLNDLIDYGGESGLVGRAGEPVTVYGIVERVQKSERGENSLLFDHFLDVKAVEFDRDNETVDIAEHKETFTQLANEPDAVDQFAESIAPHLHATDAWETAMEFAVAYLFGAPRVNIDQGPTYRGDLHFLIISDFGMGKSDFSGDIEAYSPKCISKSTTALGSGVGLTAAAVKDDFGEGQWTIKPGLLVKANGGHLILDEIDKGPDELTDMNDAIEGKQQVDVEKAGKSATYDSRTGLLALGNPVDGRFNPHGSIPDQLGISESLLSRFDGIVTMEDAVDKEQDRKVAETYGKAYTEAQQTQYGDRDDFETLERPVPVDVGQAWIKHARENVNPVLDYEQFEALEDWYAEEVRQLNKEFGDGDEDMPVPATVRVLGAAVKMSIAFARVHLREEVTDEDIERAKKLGKRLVKQNWNGEQFDVSKNMKSTDEYEQLEPKIIEAIGDAKLMADDIAHEIGENESDVRETLDGMAEKGRLIERQGKYEVNN